MQLYFLVSKLSDEWLATCMPSSFNRWYIFKGNMRKIVGCYYRHGFKKPPISISYALIDEESYKNRSWFLKFLRQHMCRDKLCVCVISDRAASILRVMREISNGVVQSVDSHRYFLFQVRSNFWKHHPRGELKNFT